MRFPKAMSLLLAKIALERVMSEKRSEQLIGECASAFEPIKDWWNRRGQEADDLATPEDAIEEAARERQDHVPDAQRQEAAGLVRRIQDRVDEETSEQELSEVIQSEILGKARTWVIWLDDPEVVGADGGRYVHFSYAWDELRKRFGYRIRNYEHNIMFYPPNTQVGGSTWETRELSWTADKIWKAAKRRIPAITERGLGEPRLHSVDGNRGVWREVLNVLTKNLPPNSPSDRSA